MKIEYNTIINEIKQNFGRELTDVELLLVKHSYFKGFIDGKTYEYVTS